MNEAETIKRMKKRGRAIYLSKKIIEEEMEKQIEKETNKKEKKLMEALLEDFKGYWKVRGID